METEDLDKILGKSYAELTHSEREAIQEICTSEEEFMQLQQFFASVENYANNTQENDSPTPKTKERLDDLFHQTYQSKGILWYNAAWTALYPTDRRLDQRPLVRIAAILVVLIAIVPFVNNPKMSDKPALAKNEVKSEVKAEAKSALVQKQKQETDAAGETELNQPVESNALMLQKATAPNSEAANETVKYLGSISKGNAMDMEIDAAFTAPASVNYSLSEVATTFKTNHSDGIYMETSKPNADETTARQNMAMLDLLTPTF